MATTPGIIPALGSQVKKATEKTVKVVSEETTRFSDQTAGQLAPAPLTAEQIKNTRQEVEGIYGGRDAMMDPAKYESQKATDQKRTAGLVEQIMGQLLGPNHKMKDDRKQKVGMEHKREAEELGVVQNNQQQQEEQQRKQAQEEEDKRKKEEKKAKLENQIEAPAGKQTGMSFGRKKSATKMLQKPASAETRGGKGNRE